MTLPPPRVGCSLLCFSHRLGLAVHGRHGHHQRAANTERHPPPSDLGRRSSNGAPRRCKLLVNRLLSPCRRRSRAWSNGLVAIVRSRWHLAMLLRQLAGLSINRCDVCGSVQLCADACGFDHDVATQSETCHGLDVACVMVQQGLLPGALQSSRLGPLALCTLIPTSTVFWIPESVGHMSRVRLLVTITIRGAWSRNTAHGGCASGVVHPWVGQIRLKCNGFKTKFES